MKTLNHILSLILTATLLSTGIPVFSPEDASMNSRVGLEDAVLRVQDFARSADTPAAFSESVARALSTLNVVAGLKTVISENKGTWAKSVQTEFGLASLLNSSIPSDGNEQVSEQPMDYQSMAVSPAFRYG